MKLRTIAVTFLLLFAFIFGHAQTKEETKTWLTNIGAGLLTNFKDNAGNNKTVKLDFKEDILNVYVRTDYEDKRWSSNEQEILLGDIISADIKIYTSTESSINGLYCLECKLKNEISITIEYSFSQKDVFNSNSFRLFGNNDDLKRIQKALIHLAKLYGAEVKDLVDENTF